MRTFIRLTAPAAVAALCAAVPAAATVNKTPPQTDPITGATVKPGFSVRAGGTVLTNGTMGTAAQFRINLAAGPGNKITLVDPSTGLTFRSLRFTTIAFLPKTVRVAGIGMENGHRVAFTAIAVSHVNDGLADRFGITLNHGAMVGGPLQSGHVRITEVSV